MDIQIAKNKEIWDSFLLKNNAIFTQSWDWGEVLLSEGNKIDRLLVMEGKEIVAAVLGIYNFFPLGIKFVFCPWGPVCVAPEKMNECLEKISEYFLQQGCIFVRIEPMISPTGKISIMKKIKDVSPSHTLILDAQRSEEEIMVGIDKKTRYEIRQAQKNDLEIKEEKDFNIFWSLLKKTAKHDGFRTHGEKHYKKILEADDSVQLNAYYHGQPIATAIFWSWGQEFTYLFAATDRNFNSLSAAYLIQLAAIRLAKEKGCSRYDFFGVAPKISAADAKYDYDRKHRYAGFTKFKVGFGGNYRGLPGTYDLILDKPKYYFYCLLRFVRRLF